MQIVKGGVTAAKGFYAAAAVTGIRKKERKDMALVYSKEPCVVAGTFTTNVVKAAPVLWDMQLIKEANVVHAVVLNSGIANACTGEEGIVANRKMAEGIAKAMEISTNTVLTASTGVIGMQLPVAKVEAGAVLLKEALSDSIEAGTLAAEAIMTTDTHSKQCAVNFEIDGTTISIGGMAKGSGMIHPNMATMLGVITTDLAISKELLQEALSADVKDSFNMISVDRDTSTNDSLIVLANGLAGNEKIVTKGEAYQTFCLALATVTKTLAKMMAADGEGASKLFEVTVKGTNTKEEAITLSKAIITSPLVKTALYGSDANWGRILCAMGYSGASFDPNKVDLSIQSEVGSLKLVENGMATDYSEEFATKILSASEVTAIADVKQGCESATAWGCDLTYDYVKINGDYRS